MRISTNKSETITLIQKRVEGLSRSHVSCCLKRRNLSILESCSGVREEWSKRLPVRSLVSAAVLTLGQSVVVKTGAK